LDAPQVAQNAGAVLLDELVRRTQQPYQQHDAAFLPYLDLVLFMHAQVTQRDRALPLERLVVVPKKSQQRRDATFLHDSHLPTINVRLRAAAQLDRTSFSGSTDKFLIATAACSCTPWQGDRKRPMSSGMPPSSTILRALSALTLRLATMPALCS
jgi:hypothetical protein